MRQKSENPPPPEPRFTGLGDLPYQGRDAVRHDGGFAHKVGGQWRHLTATEFMRDVTSVAKGLVAAGVSAGDRVVLACGTRYEWALIAFAVWAARGVLVPVHPSCPVARLQHLLRDSLPAAVIVENERHARAVAGIRHEFPGLARIWRLDDSLGTDPDSGLNTGLKTIMTAGAYMDPSAILLRRQETKRDDIAVIAHPATTERGSPCAALTHGNLLACAENLIGRAQPLLDAVPAGEAGTLMHLPLAGTFGQSMLIAGVMARVHIGFPPRGSSLLHETRGFAPTILLARPSFLERVHGIEHAIEHEKSNMPGWDNLGAFNSATEHAIEMSKGGRRGLWRRVSHAMHGWLYTRIRDHLGGQVRFIVCSGAVPERMTHFFTGVGMPVLQGFGITETAGPFTLNVGGESPAGSTGRPIPGMQVRISSLGEVEVRGAAVFRGYWSSPESARTAFREGWLATGVSGRFVSDGSLVVEHGPRRRAHTVAAPSGTAPALPPPDDWRADSRRARHARPASAPPEEPRPPLPRSGGLPRR
ncbi:long-chain acyl-CoA synthetase [Spinactinospora alkalitolerans]|uniref:Long-chain acyl-CoA synthetase n=1 Tax=Spinactinospora alkalitolerans TaxID=687207 RepID=A0A852U6I8_9ACTN|nr:AMP-binding protein [Spinactinospora alkalitolerans]NYE49530.1 long-chain acyl-CoA synthetase [Spinactinospora alkalitolerans]